MIFAMKKEQIFDKAGEFLKTAKKPFLAVVGPTASGKTSASIKIAKKFNCEVINSDSRQIFKHVDIVSAKITPEEAEGVPHHLFSFVEPDQVFTVVEWREMAEKMAEDILDKGKIPMLCGGTGLYINAITKNFSIPAVAPQAEIREELEKMTNQELWQELNKKDPESAKKIHENNRRYLVRALEIFETSKEAKSAQEGIMSPKFESLILGVSVNREELYERINKRVYDMLENGLMKEVKELLKMGYKKGDPGMISHGIPEALDYLEGIISKEDFIAKMQQVTRNFAKRQLTWWRRDERVIWFNPATFEITNSPEI